MSTDVTLGTAVVDLVRGEFRTPNGSASLSPLEATFLAFLGRRHGTVVPKKELLEEVWGYSRGVNSRAVDATLVRVRKKLEGSGLTISSFRGRGLQLDIHVAETPAELSPLFGREEVLATLDAWSRAPGVGCLWGPPGVGKTSLVEHLPNARALRALGAEALEHELCDILDCTPSTLMSTLKRDGRTWVLDEADARSPEDLELIRGWASAAPFVVVAIERLDADRNHRLEPLEREDAVVMLMARSPVGRTTAGNLVDQTDRLPQQLVLIGEAVEFLGLDGFLDLGPGGDFPAIEQAIEAVYSSLSTTEQKVLSTVAIFHSSFDVRAAAFVTQLPPYAVLGTLEALWKKALLQGEVGVFRLLSPVRRVASRQSTDPQVLVRWCLWLLEESGAASFRFHRHYEDLAFSLQHCSDVEVPSITMLLIEHSDWTPEVAQAFIAASRRDGVLRPVVIAGRALLDAMEGRTLEARNLVEPLKAFTDPSMELLRQGARLAAGLPDDDALLALEARVPTQLFINTICLVAATGWSRHPELFERLADQSEASGFTNSARALRSWAGRILREQGDPRWLDLSARGTLEGGMFASIEKGRPEEGIETALALLKTERSFPRRQLLAGLAATVLVVLDRTDEAAALVERYPSTGAGYSLYLHLARAMMGWSYQLGSPRWAELVECWRNGEDLPDNDGVLPVRHWALSQTTPPA